MPVDAASLPSMHSLYLYFPLLLWMKQSRDQHTIFFCTATAKYFFFLSASLFSRVIRDNSIEEMKQGPGRHHVKAKHVAGWKTQSERDKPNVPPSPRKRRLMYGVPAKHKVSILRH